MRTLILILIGLAAAGLLLGLVRRAQRKPALIIFCLAWLGLVAWNLSIGLSHGYSLSEELPIQLVIFVVPAALALWLARQSRH
ncbi:MAG: hypothetical protein V4607_15980 [Pseudomonadota bacterium]